MVAKKSSFGQETTDFYRNSAEHLVGWPTNLMSKVVPYMALVCALIVPFRSLADTSWISGSDGLWSDPLNWSAGLPNQSQGITAINNSNTKMVWLDATADAASRVIQRLHLWNGSGGSTNTLLIDGVELTMRNTLTVDTGGLLIISNNGSLNMRGSAGTSLNINDGIVQLASGSIFSMMTTTRVGRVKSGELTINGGTADLGNVLVGDFPGSSGVLLVNGGVLNVSSNLVIADDVGSTGAVAIVSGELNMSNPNAVLRVGDEHIGQLRIYGGALRLNIDDLTVGRRTNSSGFLLVAGGTVLATDISIGRSQGATGIVMVTGGHLLATKDSLRIGRDGFGQLYVSNGLVRANDAVISMNASGNGALRIEAGEVQLMANLVANGFCALTGGTLGVGQLYLTNSASVMSFAGGTLRSGGARVANGQPFVVGDGTSPATYQMNGGLHEFADGLIISPNATLSGCGTIIGTVINNGMIATNCTLTVPIITDVGYSDGSMRFSFQTDDWPSYIIEYKEVLGDGPWTMLERRVGDGSVAKIIDPTATRFSRFYRIRVP